MAEPDRTEADNEVARAIIRRHDRIEAIPPSPFEGWDTTIFHDGIATYYMTDWDFHTGDHWQAQHPSFRPAKHLLDTIRELVKDAEDRQRVGRQKNKALEIING